jgi:hypothetical protein
MKKYVIKRLLLIIPTFIGITLITYLMVRIAPGDYTTLKMGMEGGKIFMAFLGEIMKTVAAAKAVEGTKDLAERVEKMVNKLGEVAASLGKNAMSLNYKIAFAHSLPYLDVMGDTIMAWMLLWRALVASQKLEENPKKKDLPFYEGQVKTAEFFIRTIAPTSMGRMDTIIDMCPAAIEISDEGFGGL